MFVAKILASFLLVFSSLWGMEVSDPLLKLLDVMEVPHDGTPSSIVRETQKYWIRPPGKERWEIKGELENKSEVMELGAELGFIHEIYPTQKKYDYCLLLGATVSRMETRLNYAIKLWNEGIRFREIVFLTGARPLDPKADRLTDLCKTETEAAHYIWEHANLPKEFSKLPITFVDTSMFLTPSGSRRPNTGDTVKSWMALNPVPGTCLGISNQPYCLYQKAAIGSSLRKEFPFEIAGVGEDPNQLQGPVLLDTIARWLFNQPHEE